MYFRWSFRPNSAWDEKDAPHFTRYKSWTKAKDIYGYFFEVFPECNSCFNSFVSLSTEPWCFFFRFFVTIKSGGFFWKYLWLFNLLNTDVNTLGFTLTDLYQKSFWSSQFALKVDQKVYVWLYRKLWFVSQLICYHYP